MADDLKEELRLIGCHANGDARCTCNIGQDSIARIEAQEAALQAADELADAAQRLEHIARQNTDNAKVWEDACEAVCAALASYRKARGGGA